MTAGRAAGAFEPIAIVGQGCVVPGALDVPALLDRIFAGDDLVGPPPAGYWGISPERALRDESGEARWSDLGGYVRGFEEAFDPGGFAVEPGEILRLDPMVRWCLQAAREALRAAGLEGPASAARAGVILGNLSLPTPSMARFADSVHLSRQAFLPEALRGMAENRPDAVNRFMSGHPARVVARAFGFGLPSFSLDAACASSLYALRLACDRLHDRSADLMLAGAVNGADPLFLHTGFRALRAVSPTGRSRPFHREADGLVPAEGAAFVALRRLDDAVAAGEPIAGVIRGIGLSNDGGRAGFLVPSSPGQVRAIRRAYEVAGLEATDVSYVECHATGTAVGDATEIRSMAEVFAGGGPVAIGSLKSNLGHLVTASGMAGLVKVLGAMERGELPATLHSGAPLDALGDTPFRVVARREPWPPSGDAPRRAAVSSFGFGGNNAHLIVEEWRPGRPAPATPRPRGPRPSVAVAVVGIGAGVGDGAGVEAFRARLFGGAGAPGLATRSLELDAGGLRFPPADLGRALGQQLAVLRAAREAVADAGDLPAERTGVFVGMQCDPEIARHVLRVRLADRLSTGPEAADPADVARLADAVSEPLDAAAVLGLLPNIPANRLNTHWRLEGPGFTVSAEEGSGVVALELAAAAIASGELDAAIVAAVDLCAEPVHEAAMRALFPGAPPAADAAVALVLRRADAGGAAYALLDPAGEGEAGLRLSVAPEGSSLAGSFGHAQAASGLLHVAAAALACASRALPRAGERDPRPWLAPAGGRSAEVTVESLGGDRRAVRLREAPGAPPRGPRSPGWSLLRFAGGDPAAVLAALEARRTGGDGPCRLALVVGPGEDPDEPFARARERLAADPGAASLSGPGWVYRREPLAGETAFVFTGAAAAYPGMGRDLLLALPGLADAALLRCGAVGGAVRWIFEEPEGSPCAFERLAGASFLSQAHGAFSLGTLGLRPHAALGLSSGETNAFAALGVWESLDGLLEELDAAGIYSRELGGPYRAVERAWGGGPVEWRSVRVLAPVDAVEAALRDEPRAHLLMVHAPGDSVIGGDAAACARVLRALGSPRAIPLGYEMAVHAPEVDEVAEVWRRIHRRPAGPVPGVRIYSCAAYAPVEHDSDAVADALTAMARSTVDFPRLVERAWEDGARIFVEHGPRALCTGWIGAVLGDRPHLAVALDDPRRGSLAGCVAATAELWAAGAPVDAAWLARLDPSSAPPAAARVLRFPAHPRPIELPRLPMTARPTTSLQAPERMPTAPALGPPPPPAAPAMLAPSPVPAPAAAAGTLGAIWEEQSRVHRRFLEVQGGAWLDLVRALGGLPALRLRSGNSVPARGEADIRLHEVRPPGEAGLRSPSEAEGQPPGAPPAADPETDSRQPAADGPPPVFDRADLEVLASGRISTLFGPLFEAQDGFERQVRMPMPPLLLADRVMSLGGEPATMGLGRIVTETDVAADAWYLHQGRMPFGLFIESGQADLLLISWLGADLLNRGERVYRLLGCELTVHGDLPRPGETLRYEIHVDGHARQGEVRIFNFHYDCFVGGELRMSMRGGQAGFFTDAELAGSRGVIWDPAKVSPIADARLDPPAVDCPARSFDETAVRAFAEGRVADCFGATHLLSRTHTRTPRIPSGDLLLLDRITDLDPRGGPWGRGYLRAETTLSGDEWFFPGHFKNDPAMPGTLMIEACAQAMAFYLTALGHTLERDGWTFQPAAGEPYKMVCRGQVVPSSRELVYEIFVEEVADGPVPTLFADVLLTVDGRKAFHCRRLGLRLAPDWPLSRLPASPAERPEPVAVATHEGFAFDHASLLACAWGRPSEAFGPRYLAFDGVRRVPRLPGPPYHFISRVLSTEGEAGRLEPGAGVEVEFDVPGDAWYLAENGAPEMPFAVLLEAALQPCGWLTAFVGIPLSREHDLYFRNLDGTGTVHVLVRPGGGPACTRVRMVGLIRTPDSFIETFEVECRQDGELVFEMRTVFGHFPREALARQVGIPASDPRPEWPGGEGLEPIDLAGRPARFFAGEPRLPGEMLRLLDRAWVSELPGEPVRLRAEMEVDPDAWFFKAHFFQDPVQPGSLGIEAMIELLKLYLIHAGMHEGIAAPRFEPLATGRELTWKYRGQVLPGHRLVTVDLAVTERGRDARGPFASADAWLSVDGTVIYRASGLAVRVVAGEEGAAPDAAARTLDPATDAWLNDHRPTHAAPVLPFMSMVDLLAAAALERAPGRVVTVVTECEAHGWLVCDGPRETRTEALAVDGDPDSWDVTLFAWRDAGRAELSRFEPVATARVTLGDAYPEAPAGEEPPVTGAAPVPDPYASGDLFHGPAFQLLRSLSRGSDGATAVLDAGAGSVPRGLLHPALLDAATHAVPHDALDLWFPDADPGLVAYPSRLPELRLFGPAPASGDVRCEVRAAGHAASGRFPAFRATWYVEGRAWAAAEWIEIGFPKGPIGSAPARDRTAFLRDRRFVAGVRLSHAEGEETRLSADAVRASDWLPGTLAHAFALPPGLDTEEAARLIAVKEHVAVRARVHPSEVEVAGEAARAPSLPLHPFRPEVETRGREVRVRSAEPSLDLAGVRDFWRERAGVGPWPIEDLYLALARRFVGRVEVGERARPASLGGRGVLFLANHQTGIESLLFSLLAGGLYGRPVMALAKAEHRASPLGALIAHAAAYPGVSLPPAMLFFDKDDRASMLGLLERLGEQVAAGQSILVHVEGTRSLGCRAPVERVSSTLIDLALRLEAPVVPVRFAGGLPVEPAAERLDFPVGLGRQDVYLGDPLEPVELARLPYAARRAAVTDAINRLGPDARDEEPLPGDPALEAAVEGWIDRTGASPWHAVLAAVLRGADDPSPETLRLLRWMEGEGGETPEEPGDAWLRTLAGWLAPELAAGVEGG